MKTKLILCAALALCVGTFGAHAGLQKVNDGSDALAASSTNTYALPGDITGNYTNGIVLGAVSGNTYDTNGVFVSTGSTTQSSIDCSKTTSPTFTVGGWFANTSTAANITFAIYGSNDGKLWQSVSNVAVSVQASSTNWSATSFTVSTSPMAMYSIRQIQNPNAAISAPTNSMFLEAFTKTGI